MTKRERELMVEGVLKRWRKLQEEVWAVEDDAANIAFSQGSGEPVQSSSISDKTARGAFLLGSIDEERRWVQVITDGMNWLESESPDLQRLLYGHYGMRYSRGYKRNHARAFASSYCAVYGISMREYHLRRWDALDEVAFYASDAGLLRNCKQFSATLSKKNSC